MKGDKNRAKKASKKDKNEILGFEAIAAMQKVLAEKNEELLQMKERLDKHMKKPKVKAQINVSPWAHLASVHVVLCCMTCNNVTGKDEIQVLFRD